MRTTHQQRYAWMRNVSDAEDFPTIKDQHTTLPHCCSDRRNRKSVPCKVNSRLQHLEQCEHE
jgi:hypothetical protein